MSNREELDRPAFRGLTDGLQPRDAGMGRDEGPRARLQLGERRELVERRDAREQSGQIEVDRYESSFDE